MPASTIKENFTPFQEGQSTSSRYAWWVTQEFDNPNPNIDTYARLINSEYQKLIDGIIDIKQFEENTPHIQDETTLNGIRDCIIRFYPN